MRIPVVEIKIFCMNFTRIQIRKSVNFAAGAAGYIATRSSHQAYHPGLNHQIQRSILRQILEDKAGILSYLLVSFLVMVRIGLLSRNDVLRDICLLCDTIPATTSDAWLPPPPPLPESLYLWSDLGVK